MYDYIKINDPLFGSYYRGNLWALKMDSNNQKNHGFFTHTRFQPSKNENGVTTYQSALIPVKDEEYIEDNLNMQTTVELEKSEPNKMNFVLTTKLLKTETGEPTDEFKFEIKNCVKYHHPIEFN